MLSRSGGLRGWAQARGCPFTRTRLVAIGANTARALATPLAGGDAEETTTIAMLASSSVTVLGSVRRSGRCCSRPSS